MISFLSTLVAHPILPLFLIANLAIGIWAHTKAKKNSFEDYALASRSLPTGVLVMTLLGTYLSTGDFGKLDRFFLHGIVHMISSATMIISFLLIGTFIAPFLIHFNKSFTSGDLMGIFYGRFAQVITGVLGFVVSTLMVSSQISTIGTVSTILFPVKFSTAILFFGGSVVLYSVWGGMRAVSYTDVFQIVVALLLFSWVAQRALGEVGGISMLFENLSQRAPEKLTFVEHPTFYGKLKSSVFWGLPFSHILAQPIVQRMLVVDDKRRVRSMWYVSAFLFGLIVIGIALIGLCGFVSKEDLGLHGGNVLPYMIQGLFQNQPMVKDMMFIGILGILLSTMDSYLHAVGISLVEDVINPLRKRLGRLPLTQTEKIRYAKSVSLLSVSYPFY